MKKYIAYEKQKIYKAEIMTNRMIEIESDFDLSDSENESEYLPNTG